MQICDILSKTCIVVNKEPNNKKQVLEQLAEFATKQTGVETNVILDALIERERLGTTGASELRIHRPFPVLCLLRLHQES